jgi:glycosyltransferase involved in cell wall biosynthesis
MEQQPKKKITDEMRKVWSMWPDLQRAFPYLEKNDPIGKDNTWTYFDWWEKSFPAEKENRLKMMKGSDATGGTNYGGGSLFSRPIILSYDGPFKSMSGYGAASYNNLLALLKMGYHMHTINNLPIETSQKYHKQLMFPSDEVDLKISHYPPYQSKPADVIYTVHELDAIPEEWIERINLQYKELWVPSIFCQKLFMGSGVEIPISIIPHSLDKDVFSPNQGPLYKGGVKGYNFLFVGQWMERKFVRGMLRAFFEAFAPTDPVNLIIRAFSDPGQGDAKNLIVDDINKIKEELNIQKHPKVIYIDSVQPEFLPNLYSSIDCLLFPVRCEGFGYPIIEAMASGKPIITTDWPAMNEVVTPECGYLVRAKSIVMDSSSMTWAGEQSYRFNQGALWAEPDVDNLVGILRRIVAEPEVAAEKGKMGRVRFLKYYEHSVTGPLMKRRIEELIS